MKVDINFSIMVTEMSFVRIFFLWSMLLSVICIDGFAQSTKQESEEQVMPRLVGRHYQRQENIGRGVCTAFVCGFYHENYFRAIRPFFKERGSTRFGNTFCLGHGKGTILVAL